MRPILPVGRHQESFRPFDTLIALGDPEAVQSAYWMTKTARMNGQLHPLFAACPFVRGAPPEVRRPARQERTKPLIETLREVLDKALRQLSPKSEMAKAMAYPHKNRLKPFPS